MTPWIIIGDFNQILNAKDKLSRCATSKGAEAFNSILMDRCLMEINPQGNWYTWTNNRKQSDVVWERLDRAFCNLEWLQIFPNAHCKTLTLFASDHAPVLISEDNDGNSLRKRSFKFENIWYKETKCHDIVKKHWSTDVQGSAAFRVITKQKTLSRNLISWNKSHLGNITNNIKNCEKELAKLQASIGVDCHFEKELELRKTIEHLLDCENDFWKHCAKQQWATNGDRNTKFFQAMVKQRRNQNRIHALKDENDN